MIVWIIGIAGSGKSTLAKLMHTTLLKKNKPTVLIDGDQIREIFSYDLDYSIEGRLKNAKRIMNLCKLLDTNNINVICTFNIYVYIYVHNKNVYSMYNTNITSTTQSFHIHTLLLLYYSYKK